MKEARKFVYKKYRINLFNNTASSAVLIYYKYVPIIDGEVENWSTGTLLVIKWHCVNCRGYLFSVRMRWKGEWLRRTVRTKDCEFFQGTTSAHCVMTDDSR